MAEIGLPGSLSSMYMPIFNQAVKTGGWGQTVTQDHPEMLTNALMEKSRLELGMAQMQTDTALKISDIQSRNAIAQSNLQLEQSKFEYEKSRDTASIFEQIGGGIAGAMQGYAAAQNLGASGSAAIGGAVAGGVVGFGGSSTRSGMQSTMGALNLVAQGSEMIKQSNQEAKANDASNTLMESLKSLSAKAQGVPGGPQQPGQPQGQALSPLEYHEQRQALLNQWGTARMKQPGANAEKVKSEVEMMDRATQAGDPFADKDYVAHTIANNVAKLNNPNISDYQRASIINETNGLQIQGMIKDGKEMPPGQLPGFLNNQTILANGLVPGTEKAKSFMDAHPEKFVNMGTHTPTENSPSPGVTLKKVEPVAQPSPAPTNSTANQGQPAHDSAARQEIVAPQQEAGQAAPSSVAGFHAPLRQGWAQDAQGSIVPDRNPETMSHGGPTDHRDLQEKVKDPQVWKNIIGIGKDNTPQYVDQNGVPQQVVAGNPPLAAPVGAIPGIAAKVGMGIAKYGTAGKVVAGAVAGVVSEGIGKVTSNKPPSEPQQQEAKSTGNIANTLPVIDRSNTPDWSGKAPAKLHEEANNTVNEMVKRADALESNAIKSLQNDPSEAAKNEVARLGKLSFAAHESKRLNDNYNMLPDGARRWLVYAKEHGVPIGGAIGVMTGAAVGAVTKGEGGSVIAVARNAFASFVGSSATGAGIKEGGFGLTAAEKRALTDIKMTLESDLPGAMEGMGSHSVQEKPSLIEHYAKLMPMPWESGDSRRVGILHLSGVIKEQITSDEKTYGSGGSAFHMAAQREQDHTAEQTLKRTTITKNTQDIQQGPFDLQKKMNQAESKSNNFDFSLGTMRR